MMTLIVVDKNTNNAKPLSIWFFHHNINVTESVFFRARGRARAENGITWHTDVYNPVFTLIDNGKVANQITRLVAIVVTYFPYTPGWKLDIQHTLSDVWSRSRRLWI